MAARRVKPQEETSTLFDCRYAAERLTAVLLALDEGIEGSTDLHDRLTTGSGIGGGILSAFSSELTLHAIAMSRQLTVDLRRLEDQENRQRQAQGARDGRVLGKGPKDGYVFFRYYGGDSLQDHVRRLAPRVARMDRSLARARGTGQFYGVRGFERLRARLAADRLEWRRAPIELRARSGDDFRTRTCHELQLLVERSWVTWRVWREGSERTQRGPTARYLRVLVGRRA